MRSQRQYEFKAGHFSDRLNDGIPHDGEPMADGWELDTWPVTILTDAAGFCGCIDEGAMLADAMAHYLRGGNGTYMGDILHYRHDDLASCLVAWIADACDFTEHGGNVGGSWLRPEGERWLELYDRDGTEKD